MPVAPAAPAAAIPFTLASPPWFVAASVIALICIAVAVVRRIALPRGARVLMSLGLACACAAAGGLTWQRRYVGHVAVVVDLSPSTASATFRDAAAREQRVEQLLGDTPYTLYQLTDGVTRASSQSVGDLPSHVDCNETVYAPPPAADAVVLFSDARFTTPPRSSANANSAPAAAQTFVVADPALEAVGDAAIERLEVRGDTVVATLRNAGGANSAPRELALLGAKVTAAPVAAGGRFVVTAKIAPGAREVHAYLKPRDIWVENDFLTLRVPPPPTAEKWWIGAGLAPSSEWVRIDPADASADLADYLAAGVIVIDNVSAHAIPETPRLRLQQYVRDLGGGMVIVGGDRAFAAGGYAGTTLEDLSPLASTPPKPAAQWLLLADSSGSMARTLGDNSRWHFAVDAIGRVVPRLPGDDTISIGNFSQALRWWLAGKSVREAQAGFATPKDLRPHGPTNLAAALKLIAETTDPALPTNLLLITDAEAKIDNAAALADALAAKRVRVSVLSTETLSSASPLQQITDRTGGRIVGQSDPRQWAAELKSLARAASPPWLERQPLTVRATEAGPRFSPQRVEVWNRTWLKRDAAELAVGEVGTAAATERIPAIAAWNAGSGAAIAAAFAPPASMVESLAERVATPPRDPRFRVTHDAARELRVTLDAIDNAAGGGNGGAGAYMNNLTPRLEFSLDATRSNDAMTMPQTAPGRYEVTLPAPRGPTFATLRLNGRVIDRFVVPGRYPPEFEQIGNDRAMMNHLARATGGAVIEPTQAGPIDFRWPRRPVALSGYLAAAGAILIAGGLVQWRMR